MRLLILKDCRIRCFLCPGFFLVHPPLPDIGPWTLLRALLDDDMTRLRRCSYVLVTHFLLFPFVPPSPPVARYENIYDLKDIIYSLLLLYFATPTDTRQFKRRPGDAGCTVARNILVLLPFERAS